MTTPAPTPLQVLVVEDNPADFELVLRELRRAGFAPAARRVATREDFLAALDPSPELILCDYQLPQLDGLVVLRLAQERAPEVPFIIVSGTIGEELAVEAIKQGAMDYLLKDRLARLGPAVRHALAEMRGRQERRRAETALRESEERFRQVVENIHEVFWLRDVTEDCFVYVSPGYEKIWGRPAAELFQSRRRWVETVHPDDRELVEASFDAPVAAERELTYRILRPDGEVRWIRARWFPVTLAGGVRRVAGIAEDVTDRKSLEAQFLRAQRLEAVGALAGGVAHDMNNILAPVLMIGGMLRSKVEDAHDREMLEMVEQAAQRGAGLIRQLLTFSRGVEGERTLVELRHLVGEMVGMMQATFPRHISVVPAIARDLWAVMADPTQLHQVLMNLCVNARDAMPRGGTLTLRAWNEPGAAPRVIVEVADTGTGIPPEIIDRIFEPFFTTKELGKGTGLGLSTVHGIVTGHGGEITVRSEPGCGSVFRVALPAEPSRPPAPGASDRPADAGAGETILIVDDELAVRQSVCSVLEGHNYRALAAAGGAEALKVLVARQFPVRLVIVDLMMPLMGGLELVRALRAVDREVKLIALTGLSPEDVRANLAELGITEIIEKPCRHAELLAALRRVLHAPD